MKLFLTLSLLVTTTKAVIVDVTPSTIHQEVNMSLGARHIHKVKRTRKI